MQLALHNIQAWGQVTMCVPITRKIHVYTQAPTIVLPIEIPQPDEENEPDQTAEDEAYVLSLYHVFF